MLRSHILCPNSSGFRSHGVFGFVLTHEEVLLVSLGGIQGQVVRACT